MACCAGDEYAQTRGGNNNWYGHDTKMTRFDWNALETQRDTFFRYYRYMPQLQEFQAVHAGTVRMGISPMHRDSSVSWLCSGLLKFRRGHPLLGRADFLSPEDVTWHEDNWDNPESKFLAFSLHDR